jgi:hypothetical protein
MRALNKPFKSNQKIMLWMTLKTATRPDNSFSNRFFIAIYLMDFDLIFSTSRYQNKVKQILSSNGYPIDIYLISQFG